MLGSAKLLKESKRAVDSLLFDAAHYASQCGDDLQPGMTPISHYLTQGWSQGFDPHPLFDSDYYKNQINDQILNPLLHYIDSEKNNTVSPHPLFDADFYCANNPEWRDSSLTPLGHYLAGGTAYGANPNAYFDTSYYLSQVPELIETGMNPLVHYLLQGAHMGLDPSRKFQTAYYLRQNPDVKASNINPLAHFLIFGRREARAHCSPFVLLSSPTEPQRTGEASLLVEHYKKLREIEPLLPSSHRLAELPEQAMPRNSIAGEAYRKLVEILPRPFSHLFLIPWLIRGGAEKVTMNMVRCVAEQRGVDAPLVVLTDSKDVSALDWLPRGVRWVSLLELDRELTMEDRQLLLLRLILQAKPVAVVNTNSETAWYLYKKHGLQLREFTNLCACLFDYGYDSEGIPDGLPIHFLNHSFDYLSYLFSDNNQFRNKLIARFAFSKDELHKLVVAYTPLEIDEKNVAAPRISATNKDILWASRLAPGKRPDVLLKVAQALPQLKFHVWGKAEHLPEALLNALRRQANVFLHGQYDGFAAIPVERAGAFVYTTQSDGIPLVLIEALAAGLPVVAPNVGGISELIDDESGWLIPENDDVNAYVSALKEALGSPAVALRKMRVAQQRLRDRHLWTAYCNTLKALPECWERVHE